jgi:ABC-type multidrug transport system ATPase subunit
VVCFYILLLKIAKNVVVYAFITLMSTFNFRVINHFVLQLKGCSNHEANVEARDLLQKLNLENKKNMLCSTLSGGMKRKLSLGIALIGRTKVWKPEL